MHDRLKARGAQFAPYNGWERAEWFAEPGDDTSWEATQTWGRAGPWEQRIRAEAEAVQGQLDALIDAVAIGVFEGRLSLAVGLHQRRRMIAGRHLRFHLAQTRLEGAQLVEHTQHLVPQRVVMISEGVGSFLAQIAEPAAASRDDLTACRRAQAGDHHQQRRLADAVRADQADAAVVRDGGRYALKDVEGAERQADAG